MPNRHTMTVDVVFPNTGVPVRDMLAALSAHLYEDAERYVKAHKKATRDHPAVQDKLDMAKSLETLVEGLRDRSKARWAAFNAQKDGG